MSDSSNAEPCINYNVEASTSGGTEPLSKDTTGMHFLTEKSNDDALKSEHDDEKDLKARTDLLEYLTRGDGSVICKLCGEILQSRTHWYRHKYKLHVVQPLNPAPLFQCEQCLVYFKSRKGYIGHIASRHSEVLHDSSPVLTNTQSEALSKEKSVATSTPKEESDPELAIPKSSVLNYQTHTIVIQPVQKYTETITSTTNTASTTSPRRPYRTKQASLLEPATIKADLEAEEERRIREEKLVADIIDRVRRECEAQGPGGPARRGYSRRTTVMHT